jgi:ABC-type antimicrobial peptide transport system permease subunit
MAQTRAGSAGELVVRTSGDPYSVLPAIRSAVRETLPGVPLRSVRTMEQVVAGRMAQRRLNMLLLGLFGLLGLVISAAGVYGVMAQTVASRTREIGVRMALGATRSDVVGMILRNAGVLVVVGLIIGGLAAWSLSATAKSFLFGLQADDPRAFAVAVAVLAASALIASAVPARRAASVDPAVVLRTE